MSSFEFAPSGVVRLHADPETLLTWARPAWERSALARRSASGAAVFLVAGADGVLGRWILELAGELAKHVPGWTLVAQGDSGRPLYLNRPSLRRVRYVKGDLALPEVSRQAALHLPDVIFWAPRSYDPASGTYERTHRARALALVRLAEALDPARPCRIVQIARAEYSRDSDSPANEDESLDQTSYEVQADLEGARELAAFLPLAGPIETVHLRIGPTVGPFDNGVAARLANLVRLGFLPFQTTANRARVSLLSHDDLFRGALTAALSGVRGQGTGDREQNLFHLAGEPIPVQTILREIGRAADPDCLFGIQSEFIRLFGLGGVFEELALPGRVLSALQRAGLAANRLANSLRMAPHPPVFGRDVLSFLLESRPLAVSRFEKAFGWRPSSALPALGEMVRYHRMTAWSDLAGEDPGSGSSAVLRESGESGASNALDAQKIARARWVVHELSAYDPETGEGAPRLVRLPRVETEIDLASLHILLEKAKGLLLGSLGAAPFAEIVTYRLPGLVGGLLWSFREALRFDYYILLESRPMTFSEVRKAFEAILALPRGEFTEHLQAALLDRVLAGIESRLPALAPFEKFLLPDARYGALLETDLGLVGAVFDKREQELAIEFPRAIVNRLGRMSKRKNRLVEFRRRAKLDAAFSIPLSRLVADLGTETPVRRILDRLGADYLTTSPPRFLRLLSRDLLGARGSREFYYLDDSRPPRIALGLSIGPSGLRPVDPAVLDAYEHVLRSALGPEELAETLEKASGGELRVRFQSLAKTRRLLAAVFRPGPLVRFLAALRRPRAGRAEGRITLDEDSR